MCATINDTRVTTALTLDLDAARKSRSHVWDVPCTFDNLLGKQPADKADCYARVKAAPLHRVDWGAPNPVSALGWVAEDVAGEGMFPEAVSVASDIPHVNADQIIKAMYGAVQHIIEKLEANAITNAILNS